MECADMNKELLNLLEQQAKLQGQHMWFCVACTSGSVVFGSMLKSLENKVDKNAEEIAAVKDAQADLENKTTNLEDRVKTVEKEKSATVQQCENTCQKARQMCIIISGYRRLF